MKKYAILIALLLSGCASSPPLKPFVTDGCSLFPDGNLKYRDLWCDCCVIHDLAYWQGGTEEDKESADKAFRQCILTKTDDKRFAEFMYQGVKYGGEPFFLNWYRWGYGWDYGRGYKPLNAKEWALVEKQLDKLDAKSLSCPKF